MLYGKNEQIDQTKDRRCVIVFHFRLKNWGVLVRKVLNRSQMRSTWVEINEKSAEFKVSVSKPLEVFNSI